MLQANQRNYQKLLSVKQPPTGHHRLYGKNTKTKIYPFDIRFLELMAIGYTVKESSQQIGCSYHTISGRLEDLRVLFEAKNSTHLVVILLSEGIIKVIEPPVKRSNEKRPPAGYSNHSPLTIAK